MAWNIFPPQIFLGRNTSFRFTEPLCEGDHYRSPVYSHYKEPVMRDFNVFFIVSLDMLLEKQYWRFVVILDGLRLMWYHCNK